jgi:hypothetical protein
MTQKLSLLLLALAASCLSTLPAYAADADPTAAARHASMLLVKTLGGELKASMTEKGPEASIAFCKERAPKVAAELSKQTGMDIHRVSNRNRNPDAAPDAWEADAITRLEKRLAAGEKPETLEISAVVEGVNGKTFRFAKALITQPICLTCHGAPEFIPDAVKARIASEFPHDKATGYSLGMLRGIVSVKKAM